MHLFENKLSLASLAFGILAVITGYFWRADLGFSYLGIPAIVIGAVLLSKMQKRNQRGMITTRLVAILGMIFGILPLLFLFTQ